MYEDFLLDLIRLRGRTSRFRRVALHLHSTDSHDWGARSPDKVRNARARFDGDSGLTDFVTELRPHFDLVAITDHMRCGFANRISQSIVSSDDFAILPGMEVNIRLEPPLLFARIHVLAILPERSTNEAFARLFHAQPGIPDDANRTGNEDVVGLHLDEWVERVHNEGGICIAAHIENKQGIRCLFRQTAQQTLRLFCDGDTATLERENDVPENLKDYLLNSKLDAIEIQKPTDAPHYRWISAVDGESRWLATTLTFDAHCVEDFNRPQRMTHVKMTHLGLQGLKEALKFPDTRIRFPDDIADAPLPRILGIQIKGNENTFFENEIIATAENLNCVIGVRGSGKSTFVEAPRYIFGYNRTLGELEKPLVTSIREMQKANLVGCIIRVAYRMKSGEDRILTATFDEKADYATKVYLPNGDFVDVADVESCGDYKLRLFGWSEIENLGRVPSRQRDLLDRLIDELLPVVRRRNQLRAKLASNRATVNKSIASLKLLLSQNGGELLRYAEFKADFEKLNTPQVKGLFADLDLLQQKARLLAKVKDNAQTLIKEFSPGEINLRKDLNDILANGSDNLRNWWLEEELGKLSLIAAENEIKASLMAAIARLDTFVELADEHIRQASSSSSGLQQELQQQFAADDNMQKIADLRTNAESRLRRVESVRNEYVKEWNTLQGLLVDRETDAEQIGQSQNEIAGIRARYNSANEAKLNHFLPNWMRVSIDFQPGKDTTEFAGKLQTIFGARSGQAKKNRQLIEGLLTPIEFAKRARESDLSSLVGKSTIFDGAEIELTEADSAVIVEKMKPFENCEPAMVDSLIDGGTRLSTILEIQETPWDDFEAILLNGRPVNEKSPGQRSSAMLPLIALAETSPLVIDQPEDNLDKRLIGTVLMNVLAELKEKRQIIVCTHDPNIVVGGDAEQVIVLEAETDRRGKVILHGSIDNADIVETVVDLLEGGEEAFEARKRRYGFS